MMSRYLLASFFGGLIGAACVLIAVYVTNTKALVIEPVALNDAVSSLHTRINDFYIFAGIVITLMLAINVGMFIKADVDVDRYLQQNFDKQRQRIDGIHEESEKILKSLRIIHGLKNNQKKENYDDKH